MQTGACTQGMVVLLACHFAGRKGKGSFACVACPRGCRALPDAGHDAFHVQQVVANAEHAVLVQSCMKAGCKVVCIGKGDGTNVG